MQYQPISKTKAALIGRLSTLKMRRKEGLFTVEGTKCVTDTIGHFTPQILVATEQWLVAHPDLAAVRPEATFSANPDVLKHISALATPPEVIAVYPLPQRSEAESQKLPEGLYLLLDGVQDPGNLGTIIRTAHWFGIKRIFASEATCDVYNPKTVQSTMGSIAAVQVTYCNLRELAERNRHIPLAVLDLKGTPIGETPLPTAAFIAMGSEGQGLGDTLRNMADLRLTIPPFNSGSHPDSLNVAIATAITLEEFRRHSHPNSTYRLID